MRVTYEIPQDFGNDETRWFKFFSMHSLVVLLCTASPSLLIIRFFSGFGMTMPSFVLCAIFTAACTGSTMLRLPSEEWQSGGGEYIDQILIKRWIRKRTRRLYVKGYAQLSYEQEENGL